MKTLRSFIFWSYERGSIQYDVMVTLILLFIFVTPHFYNFGDRPNPMQLSQVMVDTDGKGNMVYQIRASDVDRRASEEGGATDSAIEDVLQPIAGTVMIDHFVSVPGPDGKPVAYKVWAHR